MIEFEGLLWRNLWKGEWDEYFNERMEVMEVEKEYFKGE